MSFYFFDFLLSQTFSRSAQVPKWCRHLIVAPHGTFLFVLEAVIHGDFLQNCTFSKNTLFPKQLPTVPKTFPGCSRSPKRAPRSPEQAWEHIAWFCHDLETSFLETENFTYFGRFVESFEEQGGPAAQKNSTVTTATNGVKRRVLRKSVVSWVQ